MPSAGDGSPDKLEQIEGRVTGARPGQRIVLYALSGVWWVQPLTEHPFTTIRSDSTWKSSIHPGVAYAALLVEPSYRPPLTANTLPEEGGPVRAVATVRGAPRSIPGRILQFSGYQWETRETASDHGGSMNFYDPANAWTDEQGLLHLRVTRQQDHWVSAEVKLSRSLGYGSYRFVVRDVSRLEPAAVFAMFTWDDLGPSREMDIEISRWGEPEDKNAQYVIQPYVIPANTVRFNTPPGPLTFWMDWQTGRMSFQTIRNSTHSVIAEHVFTSGIPTAGNERIYMNLWAYVNKRNPTQHQFEVVIEKFEFLP
ncbi:MAG: hypothetical protein C5B51_08990 [Terriglobia bacterium]|nr:MAG: hypothetical protein C5B51_08990 [Terriglobia bacterium]